MAHLWRTLRTGWTVLRKPLFVKTRPLHFQLEPATGCNLACQTCQVPNREDRRNMTLEQFQHIFDQIQPIKVALSGAGEPFFNPELIPIIRYARDNGASVLTTTNFTTVSQKLEAIVDSGLDLIKISLDAASPETYHRIRGGDFYGRITEDIKRLQEIKKQRNSATPFVRLQFVLQSDNLDEIVPMVAVARELRADSLYFQPLETLLIPERKDRLTEGVEHDQLRRSLADARDAAEQGGLGTNAGILVKSFDLYWHKYEKAVPSDAPQRVCLLPWFSLYITVTGDARPCCSFGEGEKLVLGNVLEQPFDEIWNNVLYQQLRRQALEKKLHYTVCRNCTPNRLRDFVRLSGVLPGFFRPFHPTP